MEYPITIRAGRVALERIRRDGLSPADVAVIPAAAGGPKGLILSGLDHFLFGNWLPTVRRRRRLIGASIGAWRMAAACQPDPRAGLTELTRLYVGQRYPYRPPPTYVSRVCSDLVSGLLAAGGGTPLAHPDHHLSVLTVRGRGPLAAPGSRHREAAGFALAALANATGRSRLGALLERVVFHDRRDDVDWLGKDFDAFATRLVPLSEANLHAALLASGSIPLVLEAVRGIPDAPPGVYWDGGIIDYHLHLPYPRAGDLVLYPHFADHIVPGWLDKGLRWRRAKDAWLDNVILVAPSPAFVASLPNGKLPDRRDFRHYGLDHEARIRDWNRAIGDSGRLAEAFSNWLDKPDPRIVAGFD